MLSQTMVLSAAVVRSDLKIEIVVKSCASPWVIVFCTVSHDTCFEEQS